jgi:hypothetical protein
MEQLSNLKVGDIIYHPSLGCMALIEQLTPKDASNLSVRLHGNALFKMTQLVSKVEHIWNLYENKADKIRKATDEDILKELCDVLFTIDLSDDMKVSFHKEYNSMSIYNEHDTIYLDINEILALKRVLDEVS